jgi:hypothetical protein
MAHPKTMEPKWGSHWVSCRQESMIEKFFGPGSTPRDTCSRTNGGIDPEAGRAHLQPEAHDLGHLRPYGRIGPS